MNRGRQQIECVDFVGRRLQENAIEQLSRALAAAPNDSDSVLCPADLCALPLQSPHPELSRTICFGTLARLRLSYCTVDCAGATSIARALTTSNRTLNELYLSQNNIGVAGARALASMLRRNGTLRILFLTGNRRIGDQGARALAAALCDNASLDVLDLDRTGITDAGANAFAATLRCNRTLRTLDLSANWITAGAQPLANAFLRRNATLRHLMLHGNHVGEHVRAAVAIASRRNQCNHVHNYCASIVRFYAVALILYQPHQATGLLKRVLTDVNGAMISIAQHVIFKV